MTTEQKIIRAKVWLLELGRHPDMTMPFRAQMPWLGSTGVPCRELAIAKIRRK